MNKHSNSSHNNNAYSPPTRNSRNTSTHRRTRKPSPLAFSPLALSLLALPLAVTPGQASAQLTELAPTVVTATPTSEPLTVVTDPRQARQPIPAHDGADILKTIPGFSVIRKGGTDGDPVFRGMAGSRLNILLDGEHILGGCGGRMDPPTAYVFPESYDRMTVLKGPQSVLHGPGNSAGTVLFERDRTRPEAPTTTFNGSLTGGSFGRNDQVLDARHATPDFQLRGTATRTQADNYKDGDGRKVHSEYERWSTNAALGWTPDAHTWLELSLAASDGEAAYADRGMDGTRFKRENVGLKFEKREISPLVEKLEAQAYRNYIDHVMDNFSLRTPPGMRMLNNPDRETVGGRLAARLRVAELTRLDVGVDVQHNDHTLRNGVAYRSQPRMADAEFRNHGFFGEVQHFLGEQDRLIAGVRLDRWRAQDKRSASLQVGGSPLSTAQRSRSDTLTSGFARWERDLSEQTVTYVGLGHVARFPDYWELISQNKQSLNSNSAFMTAPEKTTQLDIGLTHDAGRWSYEVSAFASQIDDYILIDTRTRPGTTVVRNIDARTWGLELGSRYQLNAEWNAEATLAYVRGSNRSDNTALAQLPPLEARLGLNWSSGPWRAGSLLRLVAKQDRVDPGKGNIVGQDIAESGGFAVFSLNAGYKVNKRVEVTAGVDNLFDRSYAEHISRNGASVAGFEQTTRVNEPGRNLWVKASVAFD
ncbi:MAG: TonB-dependent copper receptor [Rhodocyclaceae bacterium]|jgi:iron complex outermembrane receptor protein|nr:TonB-dependent copper receptor [Rhodocyclaceae bacterium]